MRNIRKLSLRLESIVSISFPYTDIIRPTGVVDRNDIGVWKRRCRELLYREREAKYDRTPMVAPRAKVKKA